VTVALIRCGTSLTRSYRLSLLPGNSRSSQAISRPSTKSLTPIDLFAQLLSTKLAYAPHERDTVLLHHTFKLVSDHPDPSVVPQTVTASLLYNGTEEASAMATTVGKTLAFAALRVVDGDIKARGVRGPYEREVWEGVLDRLEEAGVGVVENWS